MRFGDAATGVIRRRMRTILVSSPLLLIAAAAFAQDYGELISEDYLRSQFAFGASDTLKYAECKKKSYWSCNYVWGVPSEKDAAASKYGIAPKGKKLLLTYAQGKSAKDFERATSRYSDAESVTGLGKQAVWSDRRKQLTLVTETHLIVHVNTAKTGAADLKAKAVTIAGHVLKGLP